MVICFGEVMGRLMPPGHLKFQQSVPGSLELTFAGSESNVAACISLLGGTSTFVTALPDHIIGQTCLHYFRGLGTDVSHCVLKPHSRLGVFYVENGISQRSGQVVYDREFSAFSTSTPSDFNWDAIFVGASHFFTSGISPAVSEQSCQTTLAAIREARKRGVTVAFDPNHRRTLWRWSKSASPTELARQTFDIFLKEADILFTNCDQARDLLGIKGEFTQSPEYCLEIARQLAQRYPQLQSIALTMRHLFSACEHSWGAAYYECRSGQLYFSPQAEEAYHPYHITQIVDRLGTGDAFAGGLLYALGTPDLQSPQRALDFATATAALAHSIRGDVSYSSRKDVESMLSSNGSGHCIR
ncbi:MAG: hypothetical protein B9S32_00900 [Verrucomicrobia bacterium Tous-C9LFEB]|nr:MAG: hypothetical protein B9S32_00900 [Verrucomicrobia bacterium Tous-C9LFEB]